jgi:hypothetical protein
MFLAYTSDTTSRRLPEHTRTRLGIDEATLQVCRPETHHQERIGLLLEASRLASSFQSHNSIFEH